MGSSQPATRVRPWLSDILFTLSVVTILGCLTMFAVRGEADVRAIISLCLLLLSVLCLFLNKPGVLAMLLRVVAFALQAWRESDHKGNGRAAVHYGKRLARTPRRMRM
jgi:hypothetical protein